MKEELLRAIELADQGNWDSAHKTVQNIEDKYAYWIHANLHREEGDTSNAGYWYRRAGKQYIEIGFKEERKLISGEIVKNL